VKNALLWLSGAALAFFVTASAFLVLANLGSGLSERKLPQSSRSEENPLPLSLKLEESRLSSLRARPGQKLSVEVINRGEKDLREIELDVEVSSENTAAPDTRRYETNIESLAAGESRTVDFDVDLSPGERVPGSSEPPRSIIEVRATTSGRMTVFRTVVLPV
jgi:uncharacterized membrane protein